MAVTVSFTSKFKDYLGDGAINLNTATLYAIPFTNAYTFSAAHDFVDDLTNEVTTNGGARVALSNPTWALNGNNARFDCDNISWTANTGSLTIRGFIVADYTGSSADTDRELLFEVRNDADLTAGVGTQVLFSTPSGLFEIT